MRTFRKCITEFVLDPANEPAGFESWRVALSGPHRHRDRVPRHHARGVHRASSVGPQAPPCAGGANGDGDGGATARAPLRGDRSAPQRVGSSGARGSSTLTCLTYCEFYELWQSGFVDFSNGADEDGGEFPQCEPCCLDELWLEFPGEAAGAFQRTARVRPAVAQAARLVLLLLLVRAAARHLRRAGAVLGRHAQPGLHPPARRVPDAARRLPHGTGRSRRPAGAPAAIDADRTHLLALWVGPTAPKWDWAVRPADRRASGEHALPASRH